MSWTDIILFGMRMMAVFIIVILILDKLSVFEVKPTGISKVLYENDLGITLEKRGECSWSDITHSRTLIELMRDCDEYSITKGGSTVMVPNVARTEFVEKTGYKPEPGWYHKTAVRVLKATLVEEERTTRLRLGKHESRTYNHRIQNKMVIEYEVTNKEDIERQKCEMQQSRETLQQFVTMKGE